LKQTDAADAFTSYFYDDDGNTVSVTDANGNTMTHGYDDQNRRISTTNAPARDPPRSTMPATC
jgi:YD repeat-containing protein